MGKQNLLSPFTLSFSNPETPLTPHYHRRQNTTLSGSRRTMHSSVRFPACLQPLRPPHPAAPHPHPLAASVFMPGPWLGSSVYFGSGLTVLSVTLLGYHSHGATESEPIRASTRYSGRVSPVRHGRIVLRTLEMQSNCSATHKMRNSCWFIDSW